MDNIENGQLKDLNENIKFEIIELKDVKEKLVIENVQLKDSNMELRNYLFLQMNENEGLREFFLNF